VNIRAITSMKSRRLAASMTPTVIDRLERTRAEPPLCAPLIPVSVKARVFQIGQSVSVLDVVSAIGAQEATTLQHGRRTRND
jgi:hypothetical protein